MSCYYIMLSLSIEAEVDLCFFKIWRACSVYDFSVYTISVHSRQYINILCFRLICCSIVVLSMTESDRLLHFECTLFSMNWKCYIHHICHFCPTYHTSGIAFCSLWCTKIHQYSCTSSVDFFGCSKNLLFSIYMMNVFGCLKKFV